MKLVGADPSIQDAHTRMWWIKIGLNTDMKIYVKVLFDVGHCCRDSWRYHPHNGLLDTGFFLLAFEKYGSPRSDIIVLSSTYNNNVCLGLSF